MNFCSRCGGAIKQEIPQGDNRPRSVCSQCGTIHYVNPRIIAGCLVTAGDRVLLCQRAIEPRRGYWTLPAGFMENGETTEQGAARETLEEACAEVDMHGLYTLFSLPHISQVYLFYRAELKGDAFGAGEESLAVDLFDEAQIPWDALSFPVITATLKHYFADRQTGQFPTRSEVIEFRRRAPT
jgi:ADP-ribose pyrophosphatase YjhB (NUDIX family)